MLCEVGANILNIHHLSCYANNIWRQTIYILKILTVGLWSSDWVEKNSSNNRFKHFWNKMHTNFGTMFMFFPLIYWIFFAKEPNDFTHTHKLAKSIPDFILDRFVLVNYYGWSKQRQLHYKTILLHHPNPVLKPCQLRS